MKSPTYGQVDIRRVAEIICEKTREGHGEYNVVIGTDSQNFDKTKTVVVVAFHHVGRGGCFFYDVQYVRRIENVGQKLLYETQLSLECAEKLMQAFADIREETGYDVESHVNFSIHVDAGKNGPSKQVIPEIVGWINACGYVAVVKPDSYAACGIANKLSK